MMTTPFEKAIQHYWALHPGDFSVLDSFKLDHHFSESRSSLDLEIKLRITFNPKEDQRRLKLTFSGVQMLKFELEAFVQLFLEITSIHELHWERLKYRVSEAEQLVRLSFYCEDFEASLEE